jgi:predicted HTH domain antitoxin
MEQITLQVPEDLARRLRQQSHNLEEILALGLRQEERIQFALQEYRDGRASIGHAAYLAGLTVEEVIEHAVLHGIQPHSDEKMVREELAE